MSSKRIPTPLVALVILGCVGLGVWQLYRLEWKTNLITMVESHYGEAPLVVTSGDDLPDDVPMFYHVSLRGVADYGHALTVIGRYVNKEMGRHIVVPVKLQGGQAVLVNQGWVPEGYELPSGTKKVALEGVILPSDGAPMWFLPKHNPAKNEWINVDVEAMAAHLGQQGLEVRPLLIQQAASADGYPQAQEFELRFWNQHKEYAIMWFVIALATSVMQFFYMRKGK